MEFKIACLQTRPMPDFDSAVREALQLAQLAEPDTKMLFLPEYCSGIKVDGQKFLPPVADVSENPMLLALQSHARQNDVWIMAGSVAVPSGDGRINNAGFVIDNSGAIVTRYDKIHLFDIQLSDSEVYKESDGVAPGNKPVLVETPLGLVGHTICYDLRFAELYRDLAQAGAEVLAIPAAFTRKTGAAHWHALCRARAIENGAYVVAPCAVGDIEGGGGSYGHSLVIDPWGEIVADGGEAPGVVHATLDMQKVQSARARIPSLEHDRQWGTIEVEKTNATTISGAA